MWRRHELEPRYDVVIIGGGVHGLTAAYYLAANHGISNVAVLDKGYIGGGGSGRNTAILRSNYGGSAGTEHGRLAGQQQSGPLCCSCARAASSGANGGAPQRTVLPETAQGG
jgi:choline dehydrogenase-like flavoprotein